MSGETATNTDDTVVVPDDDGKSDEQLWNEIEDAEEAAATGAEPAPADDAAPDSRPDKEQIAAAETPSDDATAETDTSTTPTDDDPWAGATDAQREEYEAAQTRIAELEQSDRSNRGRLGALQRQINELKRAPAGNAPAANAKAKQLRDYLESDEFKTLSDDNPELAAPLSTIAKLLDERQSATEESVASSAAAAESDAVDEQTVILEEDHPDWAEVVAADDGMPFMDWINTQPRHIQEAARRNAEGIVDAEEAADVISRFKAFRSEEVGDASDDPPDDSGDTETTELSERRQRQLETATGSTSTGPGTASGIASDDEDEAAIWAELDREEARQAQRA